MKLKIFAIFLSLIVFSDGAYAEQHVRAYVRKNGTYVAPSFKTKSNKTVLDNYSTKGNSNPYSGKKGYLSPYKGNSGSLNSIKR